MSQGKLFAACKIYGMTVYIDPEMPPDRIRFVSPHTREHTDLLFTPKKPQEPLSGGGGTQA